MDHRVASRHGTTPFDAVDDAREAVPFIIRHAKELGIDKNRIILAGGSAGGQTVREADRFLKQQQLVKGSPNVKGWIQRRNVIAN